MKKFYIIGVIIFFVTSTIIAEPYSFLNYEIGLSGVNRTAVVSSKSSESSFYNPALLVKSESQIMFSYLKPFSQNFLINSEVESINNIGVYSFGVSQSLNNSGFGVSGLLVKNSDLISMDENGNAVGQFATYEGTIVLGYGFLFKNINIGINNKFIYQSLYEGYNKTIGSISIGFTKLITSHLMLGIVLDNIVNYKIRNNNMEYEMPIRSYSIGINYFIGKFSVSGVIWSDLKDIRFSSNVEFALLNWVSLYGGVKDGFGYSNSYSEVYSFNNISIANTGIKFKTSDFSFGYGLGYQGRLGLKHLFSIYYNY